MNTCVFFIGDDNTVGMIFLCHNRDEERIALDKLCEEVGHELQQGEWEHLQDYLALKTDTGIIYCGGVES